MKKLLFATTCLALSSTVSMAADMGAPYSKAPMMAAPVFTWTGCYVGAQVGGGTDDEQRCRIRRGFWSQFL